MKKILKCGLFALMVSGFMNANAAKMDEAVASSSSSQSAAVARVQKLLSQSLPAMVAEYDALKSSGAHTEARPDATTAAEKVEYPALYDFIMKAKDCPVKGFIREISPMFQQTLQQIRPRGEGQLCAWEGLRERPYSEWEHLFESLERLVYDVICLYDGQLTGCYFKTIEDYSEYLDIISILKSKGKTLPETLLKPNQQLHATFFLDAEDAESEEDYNERVCALYKLLEAKLVGWVDFYVDDCLSKALSANLSLQGDTDLFNVVFRGREGKSPLTSMIPLKKMPAVKNIYSVEFSRVKLTAGNDFCDFLINHKVKSLEIDNVDITGVRDTAVKFGELFSKTSINDLRLNNIKSLEEAHFWLKSLPSTVENVWLYFQEDVPLAERLKIARAAVRYVPNTVNLNVLNNQTKLDLETILYVALRPSLWNLSFCNLGGKIQMDKESYRICKDSTSRCCDEHVAGV